MKEKVVFPPGYITPPKPSGYVPPRARSSPPSTQASAGQSTQAPAGRPPHAARVSAVTKYPELEPAVVAALQDLDEELVDDQSGGYVPKRPRVIINLQCNSVTLRALTDPGLEINLISDWVVDRH